MSSRAKVSNAKYVGIATSCFCLAASLLLAKAMLPGLEPISTPPIPPEKKPVLQTAAHKFRTPQVLKITPPKLIRSRYSTEQIADFSDNGVILAVTSERNATIRTYELIQNGKRTPLTNIANDRPVALSPKGKPFQRPSLMPGRQGGPPVRVGPLGVNAVWSPSVAGSRYLRRYYEDGSYLIAAPMGEGDHLSHKLGRTKDGKFVEELITIKDFQGILERTSDDALWLMSRKPGKPNEKNILLTRYHKMGTRTYPLPDNNTVVNRLGEGNGVIAAGVTNLKAARGEQIITYANGKWTILPLPEGQLSARLTKVFDNGWILGECEGKDQEPTLTVLWKDRTPIILNDLPGWPINGLSSGVMGASRSADIYVRNSIATTFGSDEYYLIHLRE